MPSWCAASEISSDLPCCHGTRTKRATWNTGGAFRSTPRHRWQRKAERGEWDERVPFAGMQHKKPTVRPRHKRRSGTNEEASTGGRRCSSRDPTNPYKPIATHAPSRTKRTRSQVRCRPPSRPMKTFEQSTTNERTRTPPLRHEKNLSDPTCTPDVKHIRAMMFAFLVSLN